MSRVWIFILTAGLVWAEGVPQAGLRFLTLGVGGRPIGMAEAYTGVSGSWESFHYNPAGLAYLKDPVVAAVHTEWLQGVRYENLGFARPLGGGVIGGFLKALYALGMERRDEPTPEPLGQFGFYGLSPGIFYAREVRERLSVAGGLTGIGVGVDGTTIGFGGATSLGILYSPLSRLDLGAAVIDLGPKARWGDVPPPIPTRLRLGAAWSLGQLLVSGDLVKKLDSDPGFQLGMEYRLFSSFALRAGYKFGPARDLSICAGLGLEAKSVRIDYGYGLNRELGHTHRLSCSYRWELRPRPRVEEEFLARMELTSRSFYKEGLNQLARGRLEDALSSFDKAIIWDPTNREARQQYEISSQRFSSREAMMHLKQGEDLLRDGELLEAVLELNHAIALDPGLTEAQLRLRSARAQLMASLGDTEIEGKFQKGLECYTKGEYGAAIKLWEELLKESGQPAELRSYIDWARRKLTLKTDSLLEAAAHLFSQGEYHRSLSILSQARALDPENRILASREAEVRAALEKEVNQLVSEGIRYYNQRNYTDARRALESALVFDPTNPQARKWLKQLRRVKGVSREELMEKHMAACLAYVNGDLESAIRYWEEILEIDPDFEEAEKNLRWARARIGR